ncbi:GspH/FimT family pseudopilin [Actimicrobium antarcticum]|uniref:Type II secretion system protein H n=1 Tax=Actimicrobium antarcticum TaxID=1051899 RepID=A0ABP7TUE7_9BURK
MAHRSLTAGYTLVELMVVLAIFGIVLGLAVPGFQSLIRKQQLATVTGELFAAVTLTRAEAIRRSQRVDLVPTDGQDWANGWMVFVDENGNRRLDPGEKIIHAQSLVARGITIKSAMTDSARPYIAYTGSGRTRTDANGQTPQAGHLALSFGDQQRRIVLNFLGRPRACNPATDAACG